MNELRERRHKRALLPDRQGNLAAYLLRNRQGQPFLTCHVAGNVEESVGIGDAYRLARQRGLHHVVRGVDRVGEQPDRDPALLLGVYRQVLPVLDDDEVRRSAGDPLH